MESVELNVRNPPWGVRRRGISRREIWRRITASVRSWLKSRECSPNSELPIFHISIAPGAWQISQELIQFRHQVAYGFQAAYIHRDGSTHEYNLTPELYLLAVTRFQEVLSGIKKAGYELPIELLRAIREYHKAICKSGFLEITIKAIFLPLKLIPQSLHPNKLACSGNASC